jgi:hypothetical protein
MSNVSIVSNESNELNIPNIKISNTDLEVLEKNTLFFPEALFKKINTNQGFNNNSNNSNNFNNFNNKPKQYAIRPLNTRPFSYAMKFT